MGTSETLVYAVDIGNTRIHCGLVNYSSISCLHKETFPAQHLHTSIIGAITSIGAVCGICNKVPVIIAGGNAATDLLIESQLRESGFICKYFKYSVYMPFSLQYKNIPGADRVAHALYASVMHPKRNCIIISAGTAITVDLITNNKFTGGTIFPGVSTQLKSLSNAAAALPQVSVNGPTPLPGDSTETCIRSGVLFGIAGGIQKIISYYRTTFPDASVFATGGDWHYLSKYMDSDIVFNDDMTLLGVALAERFPYQ